MRIKVLENNTAAYGLMENGSPFHTEKEGRKRAGRVDINLRRDGKSFTKIISDGF